MLLIIILVDLITKLYCFDYKKETDRTCMMYMRETVLMFAGGIMIATAIEFCNLHVRIALKAIMWIGCTHRK